MGRRRRPVIYTTSKAQVLKPSILANRRLDPSQATTRSYLFERLISGRLGEKRTSTKVKFNAQGEFSAVDAEWVDDEQAGSGDCYDECMDTGDVGVSPQDNVVVNMIPPAGHKKKGKKKSRTNKSKLVELMPLFDAFLAELVRGDGRGDSLENPLCFVCEKHAGQIKCKECFSTRLYCSGCAAERHRDNPLHRIKLWNGRFFEAIELRDIGVVIELGHSGGACPIPQPAHSKFVVYHTNGVHRVNINFCDCSRATVGGITRHIQLLRAGLFPTTTDRPRTAFTFQLLETFHKLTLQGKLTMYDYHEALIRMTDNTGALEGLKRHNDLSVVMRVFKHLKMLKRAGRAHDPQGIGATSEGSLAVECPACPHPGKNMPLDIATIPESSRWKFAQTLCVDANFRLKGKDRGLDDVDLSPGWVYFVPHEKYMEHVNTVVEKAEKSTCRSHHSAIASSNSRNLQGYIASGTGAVLCGRHSLVRRNGVGDLQKGEKYVNMDYIVLSTLSATRVRDILISYDICCQWSKKFAERMRSFPDDFQLDLGETRLRYCIPKFHLPAHGPSCQTRYSLNFLTGVARTYGEGIESNWSLMNPLATSTREMAPARRRQTLDDHWGGINWVKRTAMGKLFLKNMRESVKMYRIQAQSYAEFTATFSAEQVTEWQNTLEEWNRDFSGQDPYAEPTSELTVNDVRLRLAEEDAVDATRGVFPEHEVTASMFTHIGLELEDQQRTLRVQVANARRDLSSVSADIQEARNVLRHRISGYRIHQNVFMPIVTTLRTDEVNKPTDSPSSTPVVQPEHLQLWLPSSLHPTYHVGRDISCLMRIEATYREGQMEDSIYEIRRQRRVLQGLYTYKVRNVSGTGQKANTRMRSLFARVQAKVDRAAERYRAARKAMEVLSPGGDWMARYLELRPEDVSGPGRDYEPGSRISALGEGRRELSWIWTVPPLHSEPSDGDIFSDSVRVEWARTKARMERWFEEVLLLLEEMRRTLAFLKWQSRSWTTLAVEAVHVSSSILDGLRGYAYKQSDVHWAMARRFARMWVKYLQSEDDFFREIAGSAFDDTVRACTDVLEYDDSAFGDSANVAGRVDGESGGEEGSERDEDGDDGDDDVMHDPMPANGQHLDHVVIPIDL